MVQALYKYYVQVELGRIRSKARLGYQNTIFRKSHSHRTFSALNTYHALALLPKAHIAINILLGPPHVDMTFTSLPLTLPSPDLAALFQHIASHLAYLFVLHMRASHVNGEPRALDLDRLDRHVVEVLLFEAVEVWIGVIGLDSVCTSAWVVDWCAREERGQILWWRSLWVSDCEFVDCVIWLGLACWIKLSIWVHFALRVRFCGLRIRLAVHSARI
jgi:hypothetical protein